MPILPILAAAMLAMVPPSVQHDAAKRITTTHRSCSASAIGPHTILTAAHCLIGESLETVGGVRVRVLERYDDGHDHTILRTDQSYGAFTPLCERPPIQGEDIKWFGNPANARDLERKGYIVGTAGGMIVVDAEVYFGDSGASVLSDAGCVVGVVSGYKDAPDTYFRMMLMFPLTFTAAQITRATR